ncbi:MAG: acyl-CoA synthetase [Alphaproteobacteria bacterium]|nr:acyl-CoA synthetase [Alphaproteobacteria bacterium]
MESKNLVGRQVVTTESPYDLCLDKNEANFAPLSPLSLLRRAARVYPDYTSVIYEGVSYTWAETYARCRRLASALARRGIGHKDTVGIIATNIPAIYESHFGVPMIGAVLNTINTRLDPEAIAFILDHGEAKVLMVAAELSDVVAKALTMTSRPKPLVIGIDDNSGGTLLGEIDYESFLAGGDPDFAWSLPKDEWDAIALSYTSGTTGNPKGVVTHHRGAYLNAIGNVVGWTMPAHPVYLWTLPMFHCNGWCFPWTLAAVAGTSVCLRRVSAKNIFDAIADQRVDHFCAAPTVLGFVINARPDERRAFDHQVKVMTAGAAPPAPVLAAMSAEGFKMAHVYGLTEVYGPAAVCAWKREWDDLPQDEQARLMARQGVPYQVQEDVTVMDPVTMIPVPADGQTMGEVFFRGNITMKGYFKNPAATEECFAGGWFHTGDLGVLHPDGYIQLKDRSKDIIISGGENISSIEVEDILYRHPAILEVAVVARPDEKWGETPCAFVTLKAGFDDLTGEDLMAWARDNMARFKVPRTVVFGPLPKTSTGKIQKFHLRARAREL